MGAIVDELIGRAKLEGEAAWKAGTKKMSAGMGEVERSTKRAGVATEGLTKKAGDLSETMGKKLEGSVGRSLKGFDALASVVGRATGAFGLGSLAVAGLTKLYEKLHGEKVKARKALNKEIDDLKKQAAALGSSRTALDEKHKAVGDNIDALEVHRDALKDNITDLEKFKKAADDAAAATAKMVSSLGVAGDIATSGKVKRIAEFTAELAAGQKGLAEAEKEYAAALNATKAFGVGGGVVIDERVNRAAANVEALRGDIVALEGILAEEKRDIGAGAQRARGGRPKRPGRFEDQGPSSTGFFERQADAEALEESLRADEAAREAARQRQIEAELADDLRRADAAAMDRENGIAAIEDQTTRELAALAFKHEQERAIAEEAGANMAALRKVQRAENLAVVQAAADAEKEAWMQSASTSLGAIQQISGALASMGVAEEALTRVKAGALAAEYTIKGFGWAADAIKDAAVWNVPGALQHAAASVAAFATAKTAGAQALGLGGGGGGGAAPSGAASAPRASRDDLGPRRRDEGRNETTNIYVSGTYGTVREVRDALVDVLNTTHRGSARLEFA